LRLPTGGGAGDATEQGQKTESKKPKQRGRPSTVHVETSPEPLCGASAHDPPAVGARLAVNVTVPVGGVAAELVSVTVTMHVQCAAPVHDTAVSVGWVVTV
jgi:hypothetical protein